MKRCELCGREARMYCESDQASLCWDCDAKVHGANFLVERHPRVLLCRRCQSPTAWRATGARLSPIISACDRCTAIDKASPDGEEQDEDDVDGFIMSAGWTGMFYGRLNLGPFCCGDISACCIGKLF
ncbi:Putative zinc finger protein CONSTANS-LIKE 11 [Dendrobium catenatum]|uniref:Zinc finger protein CONSTANS-LIKE 11 n=1 Tax=Dendrobium catenatum TaxID=906689 RepID=A0A2I0VZ08_9ASPA|nr:Putative zinc finger protein CONSTANS-LIKE 11 [Dendrobium catenatum]